MIGLPGAAGVCEDGRMMKRGLHEKSSPDEIRARFDGDVERFSNLDSGQAATVDAPLAMELITRAAVASTTEIRRCLDIGCGAGNNTIRLLQAYGKGFDCDLCDLSRPMLERAAGRVAGFSDGTIRTFQGDFRTLRFDEEGYDVLLAAAVLHHLRDDEDWERAFAKMYSLLRPGGSVWVTDLVSHESRAVDSLMWETYATYLIELGGEDYQREVFDYIDKEDSPRPVTYQLELLRKAGFRNVEILHKNACFAACGAVK